MLTVMIFFNCVIMIAVFGLMRRGHGSKFYGLIENNTVKRIVCTVSMSMVAMVASGNPDVLCFLGLIVALWLWLSPGTHIGGVNGDVAERRKAMWRELLGIPAIALYAWHCGVPWMAFLILALPIQGLAYWKCRMISPDSDKNTRYAETIMGIFMGSLFSVIAIASVITYM